MSSGPIQYDFPAQLSQMAAIPTEQAQAGLTQAQTAQAQQQTAYSLWQQSYLRNLQNTPEGSDSTGIVEPTMPPPIAVPANAKSPNPLLSNVPYAAGNAGATGAQSAGVGNVAPASAGGLPSVTGAAPSTPTASAARDDGGGTFPDDVDLYNGIHRTYRYQDYDPKVEAAYAINGMDPNSMYKPQVDAQNLAMQEKARRAIYAMQIVATAPDGAVWATYNQTYGTKDNPDPSKKYQDAGVTEDQFRAQIWKGAHMATLAARLPAEARDNGKTITYVDPTTKEPMFGLGTVTKQATPEATLTAATAQRGQDVTAATSTRGQNIGAIEVQKDAAGNPFIVNRLTGAMIAPGGAPGPNRLLGSLSVAAEPGTAPSSNPLIANLRGAVGPAAMPSPATAPTPTIAPKVLPGVNIAALPPAPPTPAGYQNNAQAADTLAANTRKQALITSSATDVAKSANDNALLSQAQAKLNSINPRDVGPGSSAYKTLMEMKTAVSGKAPNDLVDMGIVAKLSSQIGMQNAQQLLKGMRITNNEMMTVLNLASANPNQPLGVMKAIIAFQKANAEYTALAGQTTIRGIRSGADPDQIAGGIEAQVPRSAYVSNRATEMAAPAPRGALAILAQNPQFAVKFKAKYGYTPTGQQ